MQKLTVPVIDSKCPRLRQCTVSMLRTCVAEFLIVMCVHGAYFFFCPNNLSVSEATLIQGMSWNMSYILKTLDVHCIVQISPVQDQQNYGWTSKFFNFYLERCTRNSRILFGAVNSNFHFKDSRPTFYIDCTQNCSHLQKWRPKCLGVQNQHTIHVMGIKM